MKREEVDEILKEHAKWLKDNTKGKQADFHEVDVSMTDFCGDDLRYADFSRANLFGADLRYARLNGADLSYACLRDADLRDTDLRGAIFIGTKTEFAEVNFSSDEYEEAKAWAECLKNSRRKK